jgi:hypothetical protein
VRGYKGERQHWRCHRSWLRPVCLAALEIPMRLRHMDADAHCCSIDKNLERSRGTISHDLNEASASLHNAPLLSALLLSIHCSESHIQRAKIVTDRTLRRFSRFQYQTVVARTWRARTSRRSFHHRKTKRCRRRHAVPNHIDVPKWKRLLERPL